MEKIRLNKLISDSGYCSRREADTFIEQGRVTVNRLDCAEKGAMVFASDRVEVDGELIKQTTNRIYIAMNKPVGVTSTTDRDDKTNIIDFIGHKERIFPIGRLDKLSQGLIFLTNDGDIVNKILRAGNAHEKEYVVTVNKNVSDDFIKRMSSGVRIEEGVRTAPCKVNREAENRFRIILTQGMNRQIRRMCEALHYDVKKLQRVRIMNIPLKGIPEGKWRYFTQQEIDEINSVIDDSIGTEEASKVAPSRVRSKSSGEKAGTNKASFSKPTKGLASKKSAEKSSRSISGKYDKNSKNETGNSSSQSISTKAGSPRSNKSTAAVGGSPRSTKSTSAAGSPRGTRSTSAAGSPRGTRSTSAAGSPRSNKSTAAAGSQRGTRSTSAAGSPRSTKSTASVGSPRGTKSTAAAGSPRSTRSTASVGSPRGAKGSGGSAKASNSLTTKESTSRVVKSNASSGGTIGKNAKPSAPKRASSRSAKYSPSTFDKYRKGGRRK